MKRILFPVEDMNLSDKAVAMTVDLAQGLKTEVVLLHVQPFNEPVTYPYAVMVQPLDEEAFREVSERIIANAAAVFSRYGVSVASRIVSGNPASEILECAAEENCDLIVMATHSTSTLQRFLLGSVTNKVVLHGKVPVLVVR